MRVKRARAALCCTSVPIDETIVLNSRAPKDTGLAIQRYGHTKRPRHEREILETVFIVFVL